MSARRSIKQVLNDAEARLTESDSARLDAELLLQKTLDRPRSYFFSHSDEVLQTEEEVIFERLLDKRIDGEPIAYLTGIKSFWDLELKVSPATLIPRNDTEILVEFSLKNIPRHVPWNVLDLGTGSGAIATVLAKERPECQILATDISEEALSVAMENSDKYGLRNLQFVQSNWFENIEQKNFNMIVSNPPYIEEMDPHLEGMGIRFEPLDALVSGTDGLDAIRQIAKQAQQYLNNDGFLILEHGYNQGMRVANILEKEHYVDIKPLYDLGGHHRASCAKKQ